MREPAREHLAALQTFATANGRTWKSRLRAAWESGRYCDYNGADDVASLQYLRNAFGPSWLTRFRFDAQVHS